LSRAQTNPQDSIKILKDSITNLIRSARAQTAKDSASKKDKRAGKKKRVISTIPFYCSTQLFLIIEQQNGLYQLSIFNQDTIPATMTQADSTVLKQFSTSKNIEYASFRDWLTKEYNPGKNAAPNDSCASKTDYLYSKAQEMISQHELSAQTHIVDSLTQLLVDFDRVGGEIHLNKTVPVFTLKKSMITQGHLPSGPQHKPQFHPDVTANIPNAAHFKVYKLKDSDIDWHSSIGYMEIIKATAQIDNNRIFDISFVADIYDSAHHLIRRLNTISNNDFSLSFKGLNNREFTRLIPVNEYPEFPYGFAFNYGDVINYQPRNGDFTPIVKSSIYQLSTDSSVAIYRRRYSDYLSFRTFLDPLGFLGNNPNGFAQLEGDGLIPVNVRNYKCSTWWSEVHANFSYIYNNTINNDPRLAGTILLPNDSFTVFNPTTQRLETKADSSNYINNLDLVKKAYYQTYMRVTVYTLEMKKQNTWLNAQFGIHVLGARVATKTDTATYHKLIPELNLQWVLRPDNIFGADINVGLGYLGTTHKANNSPLNINNASLLWKNAWVVPHEVNIYVLTGNESKGGLFFRYCGWWAIDKNLASSINSKVLPSNAGLSKTAYFPQILVGYSTNLSTLVKRSGTNR